VRQGAVIPQTVEAIAPNPRQIPPHTTAAYQAVP
jgi:hypothetical protein